MTEKQKLDQLQSRVNVLESIMQVYDSYSKNYFSVNHIMKMLNLNKNDIRKYKIQKLFND
jgi:hypothetical protein